MIRADRGSTVTVSYVGTLDNGRIFQSSDEHGPLVVTIGDGQLFPALEQAIVGMCAGDCRNIVLSAEEAYGPRLRENVIQVARHVFPAGKHIVIGQKLSIEFAAGKSKVMMVTEVNDVEVTLDGNHPLAGCELTFVIRLDRVEPGMASEGTDA